MTDKPRPVKRNTRASLRKRRRMYMVLTSMGLLGLAAFLVFTALGDNIRMFYDPTEVKERNLAAGQNFRLGGLVAKDSLRSPKDLDSGGAVKYEFVVTDGNETLKVVYEGILPDLFREGQGVVTEGQLNGQGIFVAEKVLAKHDENYMPKEVADSLKERGLWQHGEAFPEGVDIFDVPTENKGSY